MRIFFIVLWDRQVTKCSSHKRLADIETRKLKTCGWGKTTFQIRDCWRKHRQSSARDRLVHCFKISSRAWAVLCVFTIFPLSPYCLGPLEGFFHWFPHSLTLAQTQQGLILYINKKKKQCWVPTTHGDLHGVPGSCFLYHHCGIVGFRGVNQWIGECSLPFPPFPSHSLCMILKSNHSRSSVPLRRYVWNIF